MFRFPKEIIFLTTMCCCDDVSSEGLLIRILNLILLHFHLSVIRDPPHLEVTPSYVEVKLRKAAQGNSCTSASSPPRIVVWGENFSLQE